MTQDRRRNKRRNQDEDVLKAVERMAGIPELNATRIHDALVKQFGDRAPQSLRTTQDIVRSLRVADDSEPWTLLAAEPAEARLVLDVLAAVVRETTGGRTHLTEAEVALIVLVDAAAPDLDPWNKYRFARAYMQRQATGRSTTDLDLFLAFAPWRGELQMRTYLDEVKARHVLPPPMYLFGGRVEGYIADLSRLTRSRAEDDSLPTEERVTSRGVAEVLASHSEGESEPIARAPSARSAASRSSPSASTPKARRTGRRGKEGESE